MDVRIAIVAELKDRATGQEDVLGKILTDMPFGGIYVNGLCADWVSLYSANIFAATDTDRADVFALRRFGSGPV